MDEKQKKKILIAAGLVAVVGILLYFLVFSGKGGAEQAAADQDGSSRGVTIVGAPAAPATTAKPATTAAPAAAAAPAGPPPGAAKPGQPGAPTAVAARPAAPDYRPDPFAPLRKPKPPPPPKPPPLAFQVGIPPVHIQRRGDTAFNPNPGARAAEVLPRLVGVMYDGKAWALLEIGGRSTIVKPGDTFVGGRVQSIGTDTVVIRTDKQEEKTLTLTGAARPAIVPEGPVIQQPVATVTPMPGGQPAYPVPNRPSGLRLRMR